MENRTKFNLNKSIEIWQSELSQNLNMTRDNINELESHLQDEIHELQKLGLNNEESFLIAKCRIGDIEELSTEFSKVNKQVFFRNRIIPYLKGILFFMAFISITELLTNFSILIANKIGINDINLNLFSIGLLIFLTFTLLIFFYKEYKNESFNMRKLTNIPVLVTTIIVSKLLIYLSLPILAGSIKISDFGAVQLNLNIYKFLFGLFILIVSCTVFLYSKKETKIKIVE